MGRIKLQQASGKIYLGQESGMLQNNACQEMLTDFIRCSQNYNSASGLEGLDVTMCVEHTSECG